MKLRLGTVFIIGFLGFATGQELEVMHRDSVVLELPEVVVTAERVRHHRRDVAASVSVVSGQELRNAIARTATDALATLPGVFIQRTGQFGRTDIDIRGIGARGTQVAVLVDGRPEKMSLFGCTITHSLPVNNVERIEIVRGPLSVLYGSDALGGVVNIITRQASKPLDLSTRLAYGSFNTAQFRFGAGTRQRNFHGLVSFDKAVSNGHLPNSQYNGNDLNVRAGYRFSPAIGLEFTGKYFTGVKHEPKRVTDPETLVATGWNRYDRGGVDLTSEFNTGVLNGMVKLYRLFGEHKFDPKDGWHSTDYTNGALLHLHREFAGLNLVQAGLEFKNLGGTWIKSDTLKPSWARNQFDVFTQDEQRFGPVVLNAGGRFARDNISGSILVPKAGLVIKPGNATQVRLSVNRGFRYPPLNYTSIFPPKNPDLKPEIAWNYEAGINQQFGKVAEIDLAGFILKGENLIELAPNPSPPPPSRYENRGSFQFKGLETGIRVKFEPFYARLSGSFSDYGVHTRARAETKLDFAFGLNRSRLSADAGVHYVGNYFAADSSDEPIPSFWTADLRAGYELLNGLRLFGAVENIFNRQYQAFADLPGVAAGLYQMPGRAFTLGIDYGK
ncbi:MAG: TonB-dependent receptor plug domain-containing protein [candidate division WOR-3 bacterium]|jgi:iron complex outermembrane receptor protein